MWIPCLSNYVYFLATLPNLKCPCSVLRLNGGCELLSCTVFLHPNPEMHPSTSLPTFTSKLNAGFEISQQTVNWNPNWLPSEHSDAISKLSREQILESKDCNIDCQHTFYLNRPFQRWPVNFLVFSNDFQDPTEVSKTISHHLNKGFYRCALCLLVDEVQ
jgi:hypothetical protein